MNDSWDFGYLLPHTSFTDPINTQYLMVVTN